MISSNPRGRSYATAELTPHRPISGNDLDYPELGTRIPVDRL
jgi:hypothetical protein